MVNFKKVKGNGTLPDGEWRRLTELQTVVGLQYRKPNAVEFAKAAFRAHERGEPFGLIAEREPTNQHHRHAVKILAEIHFEPLDFGSAQEREEFIQRNVVDLRMTIAVLGRTKPQLVEVWREDEGAELFMKLHHDLEEAAKWFRLSSDFIDKAALRLMVSAAAATPEHLCKD